MGMERLRCNCMVMSIMIMGMIVVVRMIVMMVLVIAVIMVMIMMVTGRMAILAAFDRGAIAAASAYNAHYATSSSLIRSSSPLCTCN
jgi:hypothetical protein